MATDRTGAECPLSAETSRQSSVIGAAGLTACGSAGSSGLSSSGSAPSAQILIVPLLGDAYPRPVPAPGADRRRLAGVVVRGGEAVDERQPRHGPAPAPDVPHAGRRANGEEGLAELVAALAAGFEGELVVHGGELARPGEAAAVPAIGENELAPRDEGPAVPGELLAFHLTPARQRLAVEKLHPVARPPRPPDPRRHR